MKKISLLIWSICLSVVAVAQSVEELVTAGNEYYRQSQFDLAERQYKAALQQNETHTTARYNLANALYQQKKYKDAVDVLKKLQQAEKETNIKAAAHYNQGVVHTKEKALESSIEAYKAALRLTPDDQQARENLQKALRELKKQQQEQKQQQQKQPQSNMSQKEAERKLKMLQDKEKQLQQRLQQKGQKGTPMPKDW